MNAAALALWFCSSNMTTVTRPETAYGQGLLTNYHDGFVIVMLLLPDRIVFNRGGPGHRIADGAKECNFYWERYD